MTKCKFASCCPCYTDYYKGHCNNTNIAGEPDVRCAGYILSEYLVLERHVHDLKAKIFDDAFDWLKETQDESTSD